MEQWRKGAQDTAVSLYIDLFWGTHERAPELYTSLIVHAYSATCCPGGVMRNLFFFFFFFKENDRKKFTVFRTTFGLLNSAQYAQRNLGGVRFSEN